MKRAGGADPSPSQISQFVGGAGAPVQVLTGPGGDIFYVDLDAGQVRRVVYNGANHPPTAVISANPTSGAAPLTVGFDGSGSSDLDAGDTLSYTWDLDGDGQFDDSTAVAPTHTYTLAGTFTARLRVADPAGASDTESVTITVGGSNSPPAPVIDTPTSTLSWKVGDAISFSGHATDAQDGTLPSSRLSWSVVLNHCPSNCHAHPVQTFTGVAAGTFPAPDHEYPSSLSLVLTATDSAGASASTPSLRLDPRTVNLTFATTPSGLQLSVGAASVTAPTTRTVIVGSSNSVSAPSPQALGGVSYAFTSWSDGGARTHNVIAPATATTYTATFDRAPVGCPTTPSFDYTMPTPTGPPAATSLPDGRVAYSALGSDGRYYLVATDIIGDPPAVGPLECIGGTATDNPAVAAGTSFAALFVRTADNGLWQRTLTGSGGGSWSRLPIGGASANGPAAVVTAGNVVHLVVRGTNGAVYHATRRGSTWTAWESLGGGDPRDAGRRTAARRRDRDLRAGHQQRDLRQVRQIPGAGRAGPAFPVRRSRARRWRGATRPVASTCSSRAPAAGCTRGCSSAGRGAAGMDSTRRCRRRHAWRLPPAAGGSSCMPRLEAPPPTSSTSGDGSATTRRRTPAQPASRRRARPAPSDEPGAIGPAQVHPSNSNSLR